MHYLRVYLCVEYIEEITSFLVPFCQWSLIHIYIGLFPRQSSRSERRCARAREKKMPTFHSLLSLVKTRSGDARYAGAIKEKRKERGAQVMRSDFVLEIMSLTRRWSPAWADRRWWSASGWTSRGNRGTSWSGWRTRRAGRDTPSRPGSSRPRSADSKSSRTSAPG